MTKAIYPGSFDPITLGHQDLIQRAASLFDEVIVAVSNNVNKKPVISLDKRIALTEEVLSGIVNVSVCRLEGLLVEFAKARHTRVVIRGLRAVSDFDYEFQLAAMNRHMFPELETVFLPPSEQYANISSSLVREIASFNGDVSQFVHPSVALALTAERSDGA